MHTYLKRSALIITMLGLLGAGTAIAEKRDDGLDWRQGPPSAEKLLARLSESLNLTDQQAVDMLVLLQEHAAERATLHEQTMILLGPEICAQKAEAEDEILAILTAEQVKQFLQLKEERRARTEQHQRQKGQNRLDCSQYESDG